MACTADRGSVLCQGWDEEGTEEKRQSPPSSQVMQRWLPHLAPEILEQHISLHASLPYAEHGFVSCFEPTGFWQAHASGEEFHVTGTLEADGSWRVTAPMYVNVKDKSATLFLHPRLGGTIGHLVGRRDEVHPNPILQPSLSTDSDAGVRELEPLGAHSDGPGLQPCDSGGGGGVRSLKLHDYVRLVLLGHRGRGDGQDGVDAPRGTGVVPFPRHCGRPRVWLHFERLRHGGVHHLVHYIRENLRGRQRLHAVVKRCCDSCGCDARVRRSYGRERLAGG